MFRLFFSPDHYVLADSPRIGSSPAPQLAEIKPAAKKVEAPKPEISAEQKELVKTAQSFVDAMGKDKLSAQKIEKVLGNGEAGELKSLLQKAQAGKKLSAFEDLPLIEKAVASLREALRGEVQSQNQNISKESWNFKIGSHEFGKKSTSDMEGMKKDLDTQIAAERKKPEPNPAKLEMLQAKLDLVNTTLVRKYSDPDKIAKRAGDPAVANPNTSAAKLNELLANKPSPAMKAAVAQHPNADPETLKKLAMDPDPVVQQLVAGNKRTGVVELVTLTKDANPAVAAAAQQTLESKYPPIGKENFKIVDKPGTSQDMKIGVARSKDIDIDTMKTLLKDPDPAVRFAALTNEAAFGVRSKFSTDQGTTAVAMLYNDPDPAVRRAVVMASHTPPNKLDDFLKDDDPQVRAAAAKRIGTEPATHGYPKAMEQGTAQLATITKDLTAIKDSLQEKPALSVKDYARLKELDAQMKTLAPSLEKAISDRTRFALGGSNDPMKGAALDQEHTALKAALTDAKVYLAANAQFDEGEFTQMAKDPDPKVRAAAASNFNINENWLSKFLDKGQPTEVREAAAKNGAVKMKDLFEIARRPGEIEKRLDDIQNSLENSQLAPAERTKLEKEAEALKKEQQRDQPVYDTVVTRLNETFAANRPQEKNVPMNDNFMKTIENGRNALPEMLKDLKGRESMNSDMLGILKDKVSEIEKDMTAAFDKMKVVWGDTAATVIDSRDRPAMERMVADVREALKRLSSG